MALQSLVIGGTQFIGRVLVSKLLQRGHQVSVLHRKSTHDLGSEVVGLQGDRNDPSSVAAAVNGWRFDYVFDNVYDWERGTTAGQVEATARAVASPSLRKYVFISSVAAYGNVTPQEPLSEDADLAGDLHPEPYARNKAMSERVLLAMHRAEGFPAVTLRPPFVYGPGNPFYREAFFWERFRDGRPVIVPEDGSRLMQFIHVEDFAACQILAAESDRATGQAFNVAELQPVPQREFVETLASVSGSGSATPRLLFLPRKILLAAGGTVMRPPYYFGERLDLPPLPQDCRKMQELLVCTPRSLEDGMASTYRWWHERHGAEGPGDYTFDDRLIEAANQFVKRA